MNGNIRIEAFTTGFFSFAMQQNYIPLIRSIRLVNDGESSVEGVTVRADFDPAYFLD